MHERLIADYRSFTSGFVEIRDERIAAQVEEQVASGAQWPAPYLALNPSSNLAGASTKLAGELLDPACERIFRPNGTPTIQARCRSRCTATSATLSRWPGRVGRTS